MRAATNAILAVVATAASLAACQRNEPADQNITIDNGIDPGADIEALPPDESVDAPPADDANAVDPRSPEERGDGDDMVNIIDDTANGN